MGQGIKNFFLALLPFIILLLIWQIGWFFDFFPRWLIPSPVQTIEIFLSLIFDGTIFKFVYLSGLNCLPAFLLAFSVATFLGLIIGSSRLADKIFLPFLSTFYLVPSLAWLPFILLIFGFSRTAVWVVIFVSSFNKIIYSAVDGARGVPENWLLVGQNVGLSKWQIRWKIIFPAALPAVMTGARLGFGSSWRSLIGAEMLVPSLGGLGRFLWLAQGNMDYGRIFSGIITIAFIGFFMEYLVFKNLEKITTKRWGLLRDQERQITK